MLFYNDKRVVEWRLQEDSDTGVYNADPVLLYL